MRLATSPRRSWTSFGAAALAIAVTVALLLPGAASLPGSGGRAAAPRGHGEVLPALARSAAFPTPIHHVVVVLLENANRSSVLSGGTYESGLLATAATDSKYYAICHPSAPNYLALTSGASDQCGSDAWNTYRATNLGDELDAANRTWGAFAESMPSPCDTSNAYPYAVKHNPFVYYQDIVQNSTRCDAHDQSFTSWNADVANGSVPNFAFITPNLTDDGHDTGVAYADSWLHGWLAPLLNASWFASSVVFVVYDESGPTDGSGYNGTQGGNVYLAAISPFARPGFDLATNASHYNLLGTVEWLLGTGTTGQNDSSSKFPPMSALFSFPSYRFALTGTVTSSATHVPIAGASVNVSGRPGSTTNASGTYSFLLANGTYALGVSASGYLPYSTIVTVNGTSVVRPVALSPSTAATYALRGAVVQRPGAVGVGNVTVTLNATTRTLTSGIGRYEFAVPNGTYQLNLTATGYAPTNGSVVVSGHDVWKNFTMSEAQPATFPITGTVTSTSGPTIGDAIVSSGTGVAANTSANGSFVLLVPNGTYTVSAEAPGFELNRSNVSVNGSAASANLRLTPVPARPPGLAGSNGFLVPLLWLLLGTGIAAAVVATVILDRRTRGREKP